MDDNSGCGCLIVIICIVIICIALIVCIFVLPARNPEGGKMGDGARAVAKVQATEQAGIVPTATPYVYKPKTVEDIEK